MKCDKSLLKFLFVSSAKYPKRFPKKLLLKEKGRKCQK